MQNNIINLQEYRNRHLENQSLVKNQKLTNTHPQWNTVENLQKIKISLKKINQLMSELRNSSQETTPKKK